MVQVVADSPARLVRVVTDAGQPIDAMLTGAPVGEAVAAVVHLHGKGGNFYTGPGRFIPDGSRAEPIAHLSVNMHCHDLGYTRYDVPSPDFSTADIPVGGGFWENIAKGHEDVGATVDYLRSLGYRRIFLSGHSSGGYYAVDYAARDADVAGVVLLSPLTTNRTVLPRWFPGPGELDEALAQARDLVAAGRGHQLLPLSSWYYAISAASLIERAADSPDQWEKSLAALPCPVLMIWGEKESRHELWTDIAHRARKPDLRWRSLPDCEHHFIGHEDTVTRDVTAFVRSA